MTPERFDMSDETFWDVSYFLMGFATAMLLVGIFFSLFKEA